MQESTPSHLTHLSEQGDIQMVDVTDRPVTQRSALAHGTMRMQPQTVRLIEQNAISKGNVLEVAKIAGILAAKQTPNLIPLCHPLPMTHIDLSFTLQSETGRVEISARTRTTYSTGIEVEAMTAASIAALTIYDMCKGVDNTIVIEQIYVAEKTGGKQGTVFFDPDAGRE